MGFVHWLHKRIFGHKKEHMRKEMDATRFDLSRALQDLEDTNAAPRRRSSTEPKMQFDADTTNQETEAADLSWLKYWGAHRRSEF